MKCLVIGGSALVDVDDHGRSSFAAKNCLEEPGEFALSEWNATVLCSSGRQHTEAVKSTVVASFVKASLSSG